MSTHDGSVDRANKEGLNADAATQANLWSGGEERHDDGYRRDQFGNRVDDDGQRVDPEGRPVDISGDAVNEQGQRVDDEGRAMDEGRGGVLPGGIAPIPPMLGH